MSKVFHKFQSSKPDSSDASLVNPSNWNDVHVDEFGVTLSVGGISGLGATGALGGYVPYWSSPTTLSYDASGMFWDSNNHRLGIGIITPATQLDLIGYATIRSGIYGSDQAGGNLNLYSTSHATKGKIYFGNNSFYDEANIVLGIGTLSPYANSVLHATKSNPTGGVKFYIENTSTGTGAYSQMEIVSSSYYATMYCFGSGYTTSGKYIANSMLLETESPTGLGISAMHASGDIRFYTAGDNERMIIQHDGTVGIGIVTPDHFFQVAETNDVAGNYYPINILMINTTASTGYGVGISFSQNRNNGGNHSLGAITAIRENSAGNWYADLAFSVQATNARNPAESSLTEIMRITGLGVGIGMTSNGKFAVSGLPIYANNLAATTGGLAAGDFYRLGVDPDPVCVVH